MQIDWNSGEAVNPALEVDHSPAVLKLLAVGDIMLTGKVEAQIRNNSPQYPFEKVQGLFRNKDLIFCNLEALLAENGSEKVPHKRATFQIEPGALDGLLSTGVNLINIGNNHSVDFGPQQVVRTINYIRNKKAYVIGAGLDDQDARNPVIYEQYGIKLGLLGYAREDEQLNAGINKPGNSGFKLSQVIQDVQNLRRSTDIVIISVHWGWEFVNYPDPEMQNAFRRVIDAGADIILGHHPHFINGIEVYKGKPIFYSLGSFIVDYEPHLSEYELNLFNESYQNNIAVEFDLTKTGLEGFRIYPVKMTEDKQAELEDEPSRRKTLELLRRYSLPLENDGLEHHFWKNSRNHLMIQFPAFKKAIRVNGFLAVESILAWITKPVIIKMMIGNFLRFNAPSVIISSIRGFNLILFKVSRIITDILKKKGRHAVDIFAVEHN